MLITYQAKKPISVPITFILAIEACKKAYIFSANKNSILFDTFLLKHILCIYQPVYFIRNQAIVQVLPDSDSKINAMTLAYAIKLSFNI